MMSPTTQLAAAAGRIRQLAAQVPQGNWRTSNSWTFEDDPRLQGIHEAVVIDTDDHGNTVALTGFTGEDPASQPTAQHIALWQPAVALLVADWLDTERHAAIQRGATIGPALNLAQAILATLETTNDPH